MGKEYFKRPIDAVGGVVAAAGSIGSTELASNAVATAKIAANAVTSAKLASTIDLSTRSVPIWAVVTASTSTATADITVANNRTYLVNNSTSTAAGFTVVYQLSAPAAGKHVKFFVSSFSTSTGTDSVKIKASSTGSVTFDGTNYVATMTAAGEGFEVVGQSATRWLLLARYPSSTGASFGTS